MFRFMEDLENFVNKIIPKDASDVQIKEMRKAFIAGAKLVSYRALTMDKRDFNDYKEGIDDMFEFLCEEK